MGTHYSLDETNLMSTHNTFLWRTDENYPSIIIKYPRYLFFCQTIPIEPIQNFTMNQGCVPVYGFNQIVVIDVRSIYQIGRSCIKQNIEPQSKKVEKVFSGIKSVVFLSLRSNFTLLRTKHIFFVSAICRDYYSHVTVWKTGYVRVSLYCCCTWKI